MNDDYGKDLMENDKLAQWASWVIKKEDRVKKETSKITHHRYHKQKKTKGQYANDIHGTWIMKKTFSPITEARKAGQK